MTFLYSYLYIYSVNLRENLENLKDKFVKIVQVVVF